MQCKKTKQNEKTPCLEQIATIIKIKNIIYEGKQLSLCKTPHEQLS